MRVLITGGHGFCGTYLTRSLVDDGHSVIGFGPVSGGDVTEAASVRAAIRDCEPDQIYHLAAISSPAFARQHPRRAVDVNVLGTHNVLDAALMIRPDCKVLVAGSSDEYGTSGREPGEIVTEASGCQPDGPYGASKLCATVLAGCYATCYGLHAVVTRAFMHTGPGRRPSSVISGLARQVVAVERGEAEAVEHGGLSAQYDITDVRDVADAYRVAIDQPAGIYNVCRGELTSLRAVLKMLTSLSVLDDVPLRQSAGGYGGRDGSSLASCEPITAAGWKPQIPLSATLGDLLGYWRSR